MIYLLFKDEKTFITSVLATVLINAIAIIHRLSHCTKSVFISEKYIAFDEYIYKPPMRRYNRGYWWIKVSYTVSEIKNIQFFQNRFERIFNVGRMQVSGNIIFTAKRDVDRIKPKNTVVIYGIRDFSNFKTNFMD